MAEENSRFKILIADDEDALRLLAHETLESEPADILEATDGEEALEMARREHPNLILLDVAMPGLTGFEVCQKLKADPATSDIIIVMLTAHGQGKDREHAERSGADHFMTKPFSPLQLLRLVAQIL
ncbi:MAG: response regulator [Chloroflexota bacterium]|nr:response regulator [Chloroflexota bacterium]